MAYEATAGMTDCAIIDEECISYSLSSELCGARAKQS